MMYKSLARKVVSNVILLAVVIAGSTAPLLGIKLVHADPPRFTDIALEPSSGTVKAGETIDIYFQGAADQDPVVIGGACTVNEVDVSSTFQDESNGLYQLVYTVGAHDTPRISGTIPISCIVKNALTNETTTISNFNDANTTAIDTSGGGIITGAPVITDISLVPPTGVEKAGGTIDVYFQLQNTNDNLVLGGACTINGVDVSSTFEDQTGGQYHLLYSIGPNDTERAAGQIPIMCIVKSTTTNQTTTIDHFTDNNILTLDTNGDGRVGTTIIDTDSPRTPPFVYAEMSPAGRVRVTWSGATDNVGIAGYKVYRNDDTTPVTTTEDTTYFETIPPGANYNYYVVAYDAAGNQSSPSRVATVNAYPQNSISTSYGVNVYKYGGGDGTISGGSINCPSSSVSCTGQFSPGTILTLTATPNDSSKFLSWGNVCSGTEPTCTITVNSNVSISATFAPYSKTDTTVPDAPVLETNTLTSSNVWLSWLTPNDDTGISGYNIYRDGVKIGAYQDMGYGGGGVYGSGTNQILTPNTTYSFYIEAYDAAGNTSPKSNTVSITTLKDTLPPVTPSTLQATVDSTNLNQADLQWSTSRDLGGAGMGGYYLYRDGNKIATILQSSVSVGSDGTTIFTYTDSSLTSGTHSYTISAYDNAGNVTVQSNPVSVIIS